MIRLKTRMLAMLLAISSMLLAANVSNAQAVPVTGGNVEGKMLPSGITAYLGIPFAAPPVGNLRWRPPQPVVPWKDVRQAKAAPPACMQKDAHEPISEDCLYLNVWTPKDARPGVKLPVMVYIYGGGFSAGSASSPTASGVGLAGKGVIFVAGNYRVGTFGFLAHPDLDKENALGASGNYGMLDQVAVLKWTRANIARFGGDPGNVTLAGLSAGSVSTSAQHASALGKGLFQKAMGISASSLTWEAGVFRSKADAEGDGLKVQAQLGGLTMAQMRALPAERILATRGGPPSIDGLFVTKDPKDIFAAGEQNDVPAFVGFTRDEGYGPLMTPSSSDDYRKAAHTLYGDEAEKLLAIYPADDNWNRNARLAARDITLGMAMRRWAAGQVGPARKPSYVYLTATLHHFPASALPAPDSRFVTAYHSSDNSFWLNDLHGFNDLKVTRAWTPQDYALADKMSDMTIAFMKTGNPSIPGVRVPRYNPADEQLIGISLADDYTMKPVPYPGRDHVDFLRSLKAIPRDDH